jgi:hypothetical protein
MRGREAADQRAADAGHVPANNFILFFLFFIFRDGTAITLGSLCVYSEVPSSDVESSPPLFREQLSIGLQLAIVAYLKSNLLLIR